MKFDVKSLKNVLTRKEMKTVTGGGPCGIKISGSWYAVSDENGNGGTIDEAQGYLGTSGTFQLTNGQQVTGSVSNWCCDSCSWNAEQ